MATADLARNTAREICPQLESLPRENERPRWVRHKEKVVRLRVAKTQAALLWRKYLLRLHLFHYVKDAIDRQPSRKIARDFVLELLAMYLPSENYDQQFETFVDWAQFGELFTYDVQAQTIGLPVLDQRGLIHLPSATRLI